MKSSCNYEIEFNYLGKDKFIQTVICSLTGLDLKDINSIKNKERFNSSFLIKTFNSLGYNTNNRFIKFDPETKYPVIMRCVGKKSGFWYLFIYHNRIIWNPYTNEFFDYENDVFKGKSKIFKPFSLKITSMLQVWI